MLRRKLMLILAPLVILLVAMAVEAIALLQTVLGQMNHISGEAWGMARGHGASFRMAGARCAAHSIPRAC